MQNLTETRIFEFSKLSLFQFNLVVKLRGIIPEFFFT
jgi:hypothetical protein